MQKVINGWANHIPIAGMIIETLVVIAMAYLSARVYFKYRQRKRKSTLYLSLTFFSYAIGVIFSAVFKYVQFFSNAPYTTINWSNFGITIAYIFSSISNCLLFAFINEVFLNWGDTLPVSFSILNGITIGLIIPHVSTSKDAYSKIIPFVGIYVILTLIASLILIVLSFKEAKKSEEKLPKIGFKLIGAYGIALILVFVFFILDAYLGASVEIFKNGFTVFYYLGWITAIISFLFGYLGYVMPPWFRNFLNL